MKTGLEPELQRPSDSPGFRAGFFARLKTLLIESLNRPIPEQLFTNPETIRQAKLTARFGLLGCFFGLAYATFYVLIGHEWGAAIILLCSLGFAATPFIMRRKQSIRPAANFLALTLTFGFTSLCFVEGGVRGHAIAWLVSVPLCTLLLVGQKTAIRWAFVTLLAAGVVIGFALAGIELPTTYDPKWNALVSAMGYIGLIIFMFILGLIFESGRKDAFDKMQAALSDLATSNERLVHLNNEKNEFLGIAAHDLKNPLTAILGSAEMLTYTEGTGQVQKFAEIILAASERMRDLIANLLDVNAIEEGRFTSNLEPCDLNRLVEQSLENNRPTAVKKVISFRLGASEGVWAKTDPKATLQILDNLISNALKFSPPNTNIHVFTLPEKDHVLVTIRDEGPGISEADQKKLFQKYSRLSARPTGGESSTGLGLAIVKKLAEAMAGTIQCHSQFGSGATFTLRLPSCPASARHSKPQDNLLLLTPSASSPVKAHSQTLTQTASGG